MGVIALAKISALKAAKVYAKTGGLCWYCGKNLKMSEGNNDLSEYCVEHQTPLIQGGANTLENLVPACRRCNSRKGFKNVEQFREYISINHYRDKHGHDWFTDSQLEYLEETFNIRIPRPEPHVFHGEKSKGGDISGQVTA